jgi:gamma-glutamyltranspeptidase/glutathione hydrolase
MRNFEQSGRSLAVSRHGMAATSHPAATLVAVNILQEGGSAIDAAVAACAVQGVVESGSTGIGGDCFVLMSKGGSTDLIAYNGSGRAPAAATLDGFQRQGIAKIEPRSPHSVTIPGAVEAWSRLIADHGTFDLGRVLAPAVKLAREGYTITPRVAYDLGHAVEFLGRNDAAREALLSNDNKGLPVGAVHTQPKLADTLEAIGRNGPAAFYRGRIAEDMVESLRAAGGLQTLDDFAATKGEYVKPISTDFRGRTVYECPPNGQGVIALLIMNILSRFTPKGGPLEIDNLHVEIEATRLAYAARNQLLGDTALDGAKTVAYLLSDRLADELAAKIDVRGRALALPAFEEPEHRDTVYITVVDKDRNAVSFINSLFAVYGSGIMSRNTGVLFHNRGISFQLQRGHPNGIAPGKRPMHTIIPAMVAEQGRVTMSFGVMGGHYQSMGHAYFLSKLFDHGMDMQSAMELPRLFPQPGTATVDLERALLDRHGAELTRRGFTVGAALHPIGGAQAIAIDEKKGVLIGASDPRKDGCALGW